MRRALAALLLLAALTGCDDDEPPAPRSAPTPTSKGACPNSYYEDFASSSDALSVLLFTDQVAEISVGAIGSGGSLSIDVESVVWSHPGARRLPTRLSLEAIACQVGHEWVAGHRYLVNLLWRPADQTWQLVGHEAMLLYDDGVIGDLDRPPTSPAWGDAYDGQDAAALASGLARARASYRLFLHQAWQETDATRRLPLYTAVHDPRQRTDPRAHRTETELTAQLLSARPRLAVTWRGRVLRQHLENSTIGGVTLGDALARATWGEDLAGGAEVHRARLDEREVWVVRLPDFVRSGRTLVVAVAPDGWSMHVLADHA